MFKVGRRGKRWPHVQRKRKQKFSRENFYQESRSFLRNTLDTSVCISLTRPVSHGHSWCPGQLGRGGVSFPASFLPVGVGDEDKDWEWLQDQPNSSVGLPGQHPTHTLKWLLLGDTGKPLPSLLPLLPPTPADMLAGSLNQVSSTSVTRRLWVSKLMMDRPSALRIPIAELFPCLCGQWEGQGRGTQLVLRKTLRVSHFSPYLSTLIPSSPPDDPVGFRKNRKRHKEPQEGR